tara:strand:+ start:9098 stop:9904 length:807 start_codon:yes stop_codon:yes gene_type:complete
MSTNQNSSLSGWIVALGGGDDPSWATSVTRLIAALVGLCFVYSSADPTLGDWADEVAVVTHAAVFLFGTSFAIKFWKSLVDHMRRAERIKIGSGWWRELSHDDLVILDRFISEREQILPLERNPITTGLIAIGALTELTNASEKGGSYKCRIDNSLWAYGISEYGRKERKPLTDIALERSKAAEAIIHTNGLLHKFETEFQKLTAVSPQTKGATRSTTVTRDDERTAAMVHLISGIAQAMGWVSSSGATFEGLLKTLESEEVRPDPSK